MKKCPYCAEEIQDEAVFCRYCGRDTRVPVPRQESGQAGPSQDAAQDSPHARGSAETASATKPVQARKRSALPVAAGIGAILCVVSMAGLAILLFAFRATLPEPLQTEPPSVAPTEQPTSVSAILVPTATRIPDIPTAKPTQVSRPTSKPLSVASSCLDPRQVTTSDRGKIIEVCGEVTGYGTRSCPTCPYGEYAYLTLDDSFTIISYDWVFEQSWMGSCIRASDKVETIASNPVFVFGAGEGYAGSKCTHDPYGNLTCEGGDYFQDHDGCN